MVDDILLVAEIGKQGGNEFHPFQYPFQYQGTGEVGTQQGCGVGRREDNSERKKLKHIRELVGNDPVVRLAEKPCVPFVCRRLRDHRAR